MSQGATLEMHEAQRALRGSADRSVSDVIKRVAAASTELSRIIASGLMATELGRAVGHNAAGDSQKAIDVVAHNLFRDALRDGPVAAFASEEAEEVETLDPAAKLCVALDPLDGSGNIDLNGPMGTIFTVAKWPAHAAQHSAASPFSWPAGTEQLAAGFVLYGPQTTLVLTTGESVDLFTLDPDTRQFRLTRQGLRIPPAAPDEYAVNASNYRHWDEPVRSHVDELVAGAAGPYGRDFNMRWHGALVAEAFRILGRGGLYLYPSDSREGYREGRLRLIYEAYPIAFLVECAGGAACNGARRILEIEAESLHQHVPLVFGSKSMVDRLSNLHHRPGLWPPSSAPLFATRGLFRG